MIDKTHVLLVAVSVLIAAGPPAVETGTRTGDGPLMLALGPLGFTPDDIRRVERGEAVSRSLPASDDREIAAAGVVRVRAEPDRFVRELADIVNFKKDAAVLQIGTFSTPPRPGDLAGLTLDSGEVRSLRHCRPGRCAMQLPPSIVEALGRSVNWNDASASQQASDVIRSGLLRYVQQYVETGREDGMVYVDQERSVDVSAQFRDLVSSDRYVLPRFPQLREYLLQPAIASSRFTDVIYWSKEKVARKTILSVTHLVVAPQPETSPVAYLAASRQLYGSHYFESSLGLTMVLPDASDRTRSYITYMTRSRVDAFGGLFGGIARGIVRSKARGALAGFLERLQRRFEVQARGGA